MKRARRNWFGSRLLWRLRLLRMRPVTATARWSKPEKLRSYRLLIADGNHEGAELWNAPVNFKGLPGQELTISLDLELSTENGVKRERVALVPAGDLDQYATAWYRTQKEAV